MPDLGLAFHQHGLHDKVRGVSRGLVESWNALPDPVKEKVKARGKDLVKVGLEKMLNRSAFKGLMDGAERGHAMSSDAMRKLGAVGGATGKGFVDILKEVAAKS